MNSATAAESGVVLVLVGIALLRDDGPLVCWPPPRAS